MATEREMTHAAFERAGFDARWTGGNCRAWGKDIGAHTLWISDEGAQLGDTPDESYALVVTDSGEAYDLAVVTGSQVEVLAFAREAESDIAVFIAAHPL